MNESLFFAGAFADAVPQAQPDFSVLLALACLRQTNSATARATMRLAGCAAGDPDQYRVSVLGEGRPAEGDADFCPANFFGSDGEDFAPAKDEAAVNLGISTNVQFPGLGRVGQYNQARD